MSHNPSTPNPNWSDYYRPPPPYPYPYPPNYYPPRYPVMQGYYHQPQPTPYYPGYIPQGNHPYYQSYDRRERGRSREKRVYNVPCKTLWIGNVQQDWTEEVLREPFQRFGYVENVKLHLQKHCAFVRFEDKEDAIKAYGEMDGQVINGTVIKIGWGNPDSGDNQIGNPPCKNLWVGNVDPSMVEEEMIELFGQYGYVTNVRLINHKSCGFVNFATLKGALAAKDALDGFYFKGHNLKIDFGKISESQKQSLREDHPTNPEVKDNIDNFALTVVKEGPEFEESVKRKNIHDPQFAFLHKGGMYNEYYRWKVYDIQKNYKPSEWNNNSPKTNTNQQRQESPVREDRDREILAPSKSEEFSRLLEAEDLSQALTWVLNNIGELPKILKCLNHLSDDKDEYDYYLHLLKLIKSLCLAYKLPKQEEYNFYCRITDCAGPLIRGAYLTSKNEDQKTYLNTVIQEWRTDSILEPNFLDELVSYKEGVYGPFAPEDDLLDPDHRSDKKRSRSPSPERNGTKKQKIID